MQEAGGRVSSLAPSFCLAVLLQSVLSHQYLPDLLFFSPFVDGISHDVQIILAGYGSLGD